jgi:RNase_H superfamily
MTFTQRTIQVNRGWQLDPQDIYLDGETLDTLHDPHIVRLPAAERAGALRFGFAVTYDEMFGWRTWTTSLVYLLWTHLTMPDIRIVGWDIEEYDLPVIRHAVQTQYDEAVTSLDLSAQIITATHRHYKLDSIARANLGRGKILDKGLVIEWLRAGDSGSMIKVTEHCRNNVQLVMDLIGIIRQDRPLVLPGRQQSADLGWDRMNEATLRIFFTPQGEWTRCEDMKGHMITQRQL